MDSIHQARLAQSVEHQTWNRRVVGCKLFKGVRTSFKLTRVVKRQRSSLKVQGQGHECCRTRMSPVVHLIVIWLPIKTEYQNVTSGRRTTRCRTKWSLQATVLNAVDRCFPKNGVETSCMAKVVLLVPVLSYLLFILINGFHFVIAFYFHRWNVYISRTLSSLRIFKNL